MDIKRFSEAEVLDDYRTGMQLVADQIRVLVGEQVAASVAGLTVEELSGVNPSFADSTLILDSEGARLLSQVYRFAFLGKLSLWLADELADEAIQRWETIFTGLRTCATADRGGAVFEKCLHTLRVAHLRALFMPGVYVYSYTNDGKDLVQGYIHLRELAVLSGLEEKTLRNMGAATHKQHLQTTKRGSRTYVALDIALPWLKARGLKPIVLDAPPEKRDLRTNPFYSKADLANYVKLQSERVGLLAESGEKLKTLEPALVDGLSALMNGETIEDVVLLEKLAAVLNSAETKDFVEAVADIGVMAAKIKPL